MRWNADIGSIPYRKKNANLLIPLELRKLWIRNFYNWMKKSYRINFWLKKQRQCKRGLENITDSLLNGILPTHI